MCFLIYWNHFLTNRNFKCFLKKTFCVVRLVPDRSSTDGHSKEEKNKRPFHLTCSSLFQIVFSLFLPFFFLNRSNPRLFVVFLLKFSRIFVLKCRVMVWKTRAKKSITSSSSDFQCSRFQFKSNQETYEKLNIFRSIWAKRKVILDEVNPKIRRNFERVEVGYLFRMLGIPLWLLWLESFIQTSLSTPMILTFTMWRVCHYSWGSGFCSWCIFGTTTYVPLNRVSPIDDIMSLLTGTTIS